MQWIKQPGNTLIAQSSIGHLAGIYPFLLTADRAADAKDDSFKENDDAMTSENPDRKNFGQYFTPRDIASFMLDLSQTSANAKVLEPSSGEGVFLNLLEERGYGDLLAFEIDPGLARERRCVRCESFVSAELPHDFDLVIGNPPYIRWKNLTQEFKDELAENFLWQKHFNSLCDYACIFMLKGVEVLKEGGELIFICPEYWMNTTHAISLRNYLLDHGYFSDIYIFNEAPIFKGATVSSVVFRFVKTTAKEKPAMRIAKFVKKRNIDSDILKKLQKREPVSDVEYLELPQFGIGERWVFAAKEEAGRLKSLMKSCRAADQSACLGNDYAIAATVGDVCDIGNGMVSGLDKVFQVPGDLPLTKDEQHDSIWVYKAKDLSPYFALQPTRYVYVPENITEESEFERLYPHFHSLMKPCAGQLDRRYQYNSRIPYWQWCFKRNEKLFSRKEPRIFVPCKERISAKSFVRFALADSGFYPTQDVSALFRKEKTKESIEYILAYLNHPLVFKWIKYYGISKGNIVEFSEKPLSSIPFRKINWENERERAAHERITALVKELLDERKPSLIRDINEQFEELLK